MLIAISYCAKDQNQAERLATWCAELGCGKGHSLLLLQDASVTNSEAVMRHFQAAFDLVTVLQARNPYDTWAEAPNHAFATLARHIENNKLAPYWLYLEPDAVPLEANCFTAIEKEHLESKKQFMGDFVKGIQGSVDHMSGIGIYPGVMTQHAGFALIAGDQPWDIAAAIQIVPKCHFTELIHHTWRGLRFSNLDQLRSMIGPVPVLYHADKTGQTIELLRAKMNLPAPVLASIQTLRTSGGIRPSEESEARESTHPPVTIPACEPETHSRGGQIPSTVLTQPAPASVEPERLTATPDEILAMTRGKNGITPWADREESLAYIDWLASEAKRFCTAPRYVTVVRERLKLAGVIKKLR